MTYGKDVPAAIESVPATRNTEKKGETSEEDSPYTMNMAEFYDHGRVRGYSPHTGLSITTPSCRLQSELFGSGTIPAKTGLQAGERTTRQTLSTLQPPSSTFLIFFNSTASGTGL